MSNFRSISLNVFFLVVASCFLACGTAFANPTNLLINPGFETGNFSGWTVTGDSPNFGVATSGTLITDTYPGFGSTTVLVNSGTYAGYAVVCAAGGCVPSGDSSPDVLNLSQNANLIAGDTYTASFWLAAGGGPYFNGAEILVNGTPISLNPVANVSSAYQLVSGSFTASSSISSIDFLINGSGYGDAGFSFDDFSLVGQAAATPEPSSLLLLATGLLGLGAAVRRFADR